LSSNGMIFLFRLHQLERCRCRVILMLIASACLVNISESKRKTPSHESFSRSANLFFSFSNHHPNDDISLSSISIIKDDIMVDYICTYISKYRMFWYRNNFVYTRHMMISVAREKRNRRHLLSPSSRSYLVDEWRRV
jgi:hypothetical protein